MPRTAIQIELKHYVNNHGFDAHLEGNGIVLAIPVTTKEGTSLIEYSYVETYRQARQALGY